MKISSNNKILLFILIILILLCLILNNTSENYYNFQITNPEKEYLDLLQKSRYSSMSNNSLLATDYSTKMPQKKAKLDELDDSIDKMEEKMYMLKTVGTTSSFDKKSPNINKTKYILSQNHY